MRIFSRLDEANPGRSGSLNTGDFIERGAEMQAGNVASSTALVWLAPIAALLDESLTRLEKELLTCLENDG